MCGNQYTSLPPTAIAEPNNDKATDIKGIQTLPNQTDIKS